MNDKRFNTIKENLIDSVEEDFGYFKELETLKDTKTIGELLDALIPIFGLKAFDILKLFVTRMFTYHVGDDIAIGGEYKNKR